VHSVGREFKVSDPVPAGGEASATGETQSLVHHPPHTEHDVSGAPDRVAPTVNRVAITISIMLVGGGAFSIDGMIYKGEAYRPPVSRIA